MYIIIVGAGGIGRRLTELCLSEGHNNIVVIDKDQVKCEDIARKYDAATIHADATQEEILDELDIKKADVLIATTNDDATNMLIVSFAKNRGVKNLISVVNQEESKCLYQEKGVRMVKKPDMLMAEMIYKSIKYPTIEGYLNLNGYAEVIRLPINKDSYYFGKTIKEVWSQHKGVVIGIEREKRFIIPTTEIQFSKGDIISVLVPKEKVDKIVKLFSE
ncbi:MAG TPA: TrkA family potassium uptake protein [Candidatus Thermoplasmatota archaeon]|nr:TrkA family potassium uptake protein [Candidatus Thermoplasmatota archaeon]